MPSKRKQAKATAPGKGAKRSRGYSPPPPTPEPSPGRRAPHERGRHSQPEPEHEEEEEGGAVAPGEQTQAWNQVMASQKKQDEDQDGEFHGSAHAAYVLLHGHTIQAETLRTTSLYALAGACRVR